MNVNLIHIYIEGGGDITKQREKLRRGFDRLFSQIKEKARTKGWSLRFECCGSRGQAYKDFKNATQELNRINALLVDSEGYVANYVNMKDDGDIRINYLKRREDWSFDKIDPKNVHLMIQCMETWFLADVEALKRVYKKDFNDRAIPNCKNLEKLSKQSIEEALTKFTKNTKKGNYYKGSGKINDATIILSELRIEKIAQSCPRFNAFLCWLEDTINPDLSIHTRYIEGLIQLLAHVAPKWKSSSKLVIYTSDGVKAPDVTLASPEYHALHLKDTGYVTEAPEICIEVMSPSNSWQEMQDKMPLYFEVGAQEVWIVDVEGKVFFFADSNEKLQNSR